MIFNKKFMDYLIFIFIFDTMKVKKSTYKTYSSKGDRLKWVTIKEVKTVKLTTELILGKPLDLNELSKRNNNFHSSNVLVP